MATDTHAGSPRKHKQEQKLQLSFLAIRYPHTVIICHIDGFYNAKPIGNYSMNRLLRLAAFPLFLALSVGSSHASTLAYQSIVTIRVLHSWGTRSLH
jgi:hypothetical protein